MPKDAEQALKDAVSASKLMTYTREVSRWVRLSGSDEEARAFEYLETTLKSFGLAVRRFDHDALVSWPGTASLEIAGVMPCLLYTSPSPRDLSTSRMPSSA